MGYELGDESKGGLYNVVGVNDRVVLQQEQVECRHVNWKLLDI